MKRLTVLVFLLAAGMLSGASPSNAPAPACRAAALFTPLRPVAAASATVQAPQCSECSDRCKKDVDNCKEGSVKSCYLAAACLCQCNMDAGGCGSGLDALKECVDKNKKAARELEGN
jgi:hypothetical protein